MMTDYPQNVQKEFYNKHHPSYLEYKKNIPYAKYLVGILLSALSGPKNHILEAGSGQGRFTFELSKHVGNLTAIDIAGNEIKLLNKFRRKFGNKNIITIVGDLLKINKICEKNKYDHIAGFFILHHLPKERLNVVVNNLLPLLNKGGRMSFIEPNNLYPFHAVQWIVEKDMNWNIEKGIYTNFIGRFKKACLKKGCRIILSRKFGFMPPFLINSMPSVIYIDKLLEKIPLINQIFCPFIILSVEKSV